MENLDKLTKKITAFDSFQDLLDAKGGYYPSLRCSPIHGRRIDSTHLNCRNLADAYDKAQAERGDGRRAYRG